MICRRFWSYNIVCSTVFHPIHCKGSIVLDDSNFDIFYASYEIQPVSIARNDLGMWNVPVKYTHWQWSMPELPSEHVPLVISKWTWAMGFTHIIVSFWNSDSEMAHLTTTTSTWPGMQHTIPMCRSLVKSVFVITARGEPRVCNHRLNFTHACASHSRT